jgi:hypothetical protein
VSETAGAPHPRSSWPKAAMVSSPNRRTKCKTNPSRAHDLNKMSARARQTKPPQRQDRTRAAHYRNRASKPAAGSNLCPSIRIAQENAKRTHRLRLSPEKQGGRLVGKRTHRKPGRTQPRQPCPVPTWRKAVKGPHSIGLRSNPARFFRRWYNRQQRGHACLEPVRIYPVPWAHFAKVLSRNRVLPAEP